MLEFRIGLQNGKQAIPSDLSSVKIESGEMFKRGEMEKSSFRYRLAVSEPEFPQVGARFPQRLHYPIAHEFTAVQTQMSQSTAPLV